VGPFPVVFAGLIGSSAPTLGHVLLPSEYATKKRKLTSGGLLAPVVQAPMYYYSSAEIDLLAVKFRAMRMYGAQYLDSLKAFLRQQG